MSLFGGSNKDPYEPGKSERERLSQNQPEKEPNPNRPSNARIAIWIIVGAVGLYFIGSGIYGILTQ